MHVLYIDSLWHYCPGININMNTIIININRNITSLTGLLNCWKCWKIRL